MHSGTTQTRFSNYCATAPVSPEVVAGVRPVDVGVDGRRVCLRGGAAGAAGAAGLRHRRAAGVDAGRRRRVGRVLGRLRRQLEQERRRPLRQHGHDR